MFYNKVIYTNNNRWTLQDHFYLVGTGYILIFSGIIVTIIGCITKIIKNHKNEK